MGRGTEAVENHWSSLNHWQRLRYVWMLAQVLLVVTMERLLNRISSARLSFCLGS